MSMRRAVILLVSAVVLTASASDTRTESKPPTLTPKAAEAVIKARQYSGSHTQLNAAAGAQSGRPAAENPASRSTRVVVRPDGSLRAYLGDEHMNDLVAVKKADGEVSTQCAPGADPKVAERHLHAEVK
jgi:hypothetical protein